MKHSKTLLHHACLLIVAASFCCPSALAAGANLHVAKGGNDGSLGTIDAPFATLEGARDAVRKLRKSAALPAGGVTVWIAGGDYSLAATFELTREDSGVDGAPVIFRAMPDQTVCFDANNAVDPKLWKPLSPAAARRIHPKADRSKLAELDLTGLDLKRVKRFAPGNRFTDQWYIIDLFANGRRQPLSQWPNPQEKIGRNDEGWVTMNGSKDNRSFFFGPGGRPQDGDTRNEVDADGTQRSKRWQASLASGHEIWLKGLWRTPWEPQTIRVSEINAQESWIGFSEEPPSGMGSKYSPVANQKPLWRVGSGKENWYALNLLEEIDQPGEWALDVRDQKIYYYPPAPLETLRVSIADRDTPVIRLNAASHIQLIGLGIQGGMGHGIEIVDGSDNRVAGCTISNIGNSGIRLERGVRNTLQSNDIADGAGWGIELSKLGDRKQLIHSDTVVLNNHIHHVGRLAFKEAIRIESCIGITVSHNLMHDLPKGAVRTDLMNDCLFEYNEVHNIALRESDTGSFYNYGGWTTYGNVWRYNFMHHTNRANGFYSDDGTSGATYVKNIVQGSIKALHFGGGHHNLALNNLFVENEAQSVDDRGIARGYRAETAYGQRLRDMHPDEQPWKSYGEELARKFGYKDKLWSDVLDPAWKPEYPKGTVVADNVSVASGPFRAPANRGVDVRDNIILDSVAAARFHDYAGMDLRSSNAQILAKFPELNEVFPNMGLITDAYRLKVPGRKATGGLANRSKDGDSRNEDPVK